MSIIVSKKDERTVAEVVGRQRFIGRVINGRVVMVEAK